MGRVRSLAYLGYRALLAHPLRRLSRRGSGRERFLASYGAEGLSPTSPEDRAVAEAASACISCGLCEAACPLAGVAPSVRDLGLRAAFRLYSKSVLALAASGDALAPCGACTGCEPLCPTGVPISRLVRHLASRAART
ncbi:MAG TPA: 4Fe-4S dicluster domain-containing protein [Anaeromyxobacteraceae bacterium]|nr:4Fe-4S dicluster domain-containing protein [Anaeromyxobacteraceae bacterium]